MQRRVWLIIAIGVVVLALGALLAWALLTSRLPQVELRIIGPMVLSRQSEVSLAEVQKAIQDAIALPLEAFSKSVENLARSIIEAFDLPSTP
jgi:hypothetical protein